MIVSLDAASAILLLLSLHDVVSSTLGSFLSDLSHIAVLKRAELASEHIVNVLLFSDAPWRCKIGNTPVYACVEPYTYTPSLFPDNVRCYISGGTGASVLRTITGCDDSVNGQWVVEKRFWACVGDPLTCTPEEYVIRVTHP